ncbi:MAG: T9SS type A sorting domain-containing protein [Bacteroidetes bacterium]|nr:T9SS type A sorting domain-containing protein [Bacteroidota bacterium]
MLGGRTFLTYNSKLYCGGISFGPVGKSTVYCWNTSTSIWDTVGTKINNVNILCEFNNEIYCGGDFKISQGAQADYIAKLSASTGIKNNSITHLDVKIYPVPFTDRINIDCNCQSEIKKIIVINTLGQSVYFSTSLNQNNEIDLSFLSNGVYYLKIQSNSLQKTVKIIKE